MVFDNDSAIQRVGTWAEELDTPGSWDDYMVAHNGYSGMVATYGGDDTYLDLTDDVADLKVTWFFRCRGAGTITAYDDYDPDWTLPYELPAHSMGSKSVSSGSTTVGTWVEIQFDSATTWTTADLMSDSGGVARMGFVVSGGNIAIDTIQMRVWPKTGVHGWWSARTSEDHPIYADVQPWGYDADLGASPDYEEFDFDDDGGAGQDTAWASMIGSIPVGDTEYPGTLHTGYGSGATIVEGTVISSLDGSQHIGKFRYAANPIGISLSQPLDFVTPNPFTTEEEGEDFIRRPDRVPDDLRAYFEYPLPTMTPAVTGWTNDLVHVGGYRLVYGTLEEAWPTGGGAHGITINFHTWADPPPFEGRPISTSLPFDIGGYKVELADVSGGDPATDTYVDASLPLEPKFLVTLGNSFTFDQPPHVNIPRDVSFAGGVIVQTAAVDFGANDGGDGYLTANVTVPGYRVWDPNGTRGGQLKHRLGDSTWRTMGVDAAGRMKFRTEDFTWWEESKSTDDPGPLQYLHFMTRWGWPYTIPFRPES
jgi:hypothetical protein